MSEFRTRRPTGRASYPIVLLAGVEGGGKSWAAAEATGLPYFKRSFWIEIGEQMADEYGNVPGADYEIVEHDGSYRQILGAVRWCAQQSKEAPGVLVLDSMSELWAMLSDEQQLAANARMDRKAAQNRGRRRGEDEEADISVDLWNKAKDRSNDLMDALREFNGLVLVTARLENQAVIGAGGAPTGDRIWKIRAHKDVPFYAQVIMQAREPRKWTMTKVASTKLFMPEEGSMAWPEFTIEELLIRMELDGDREVAERNFVRADPQAGYEEEHSATANQRERQRNQPDADEPRGDLPALPPKAEWQRQVQEAEQNLDKEELVRLYKMAKVGKNRVYVALAESAGKRVARQLEAQEKAAAKVAAEQKAAEPEQAAAEPEQDAPVTSEGSGFEHENEAPPEEPEQDEEAMLATLDAAREAELAEEAAKTAAAPAVDEGTDAEPDPPESRKLTALRRGVLQALTDHFGGDTQEVVDQVIGHYGLEPDDVSTKRLQALLKYLQGK